ncbi:hypothetical protein GXY_12413 [Novacetimonas hansenii ATCC 23769]|uniref:Uncharacterized protein n=1 Tax=Novacetimonas hansenii ATCC 23769 TaxID=714995 RepID=D5QGZ5_NOVHA|nr:hypothetical protein GXY_12413 [Novacetimonas hansenii ATCC 23769]
MTRIIAGSSPGYSWRRTFMIQGVISPAPQPAPTMGPYPCGMPATRYPARKGTADA